MTKPYLSTEEAAGYLGVAAQTLRNWRSQGRSPAYIKLNKGKLVRYLQADLDAFIADHTPMHGEVCDG
jgi:excisionase family DNA binding protein